MHTPLRPWRAVALALLGLGLGALALARASAEDPKPAEKPAEAPAPKPEDKPAENPAEKPAEPAPEKAPEFTLKDLDGKDVKLSDFAGKWVVLEWTNYDCPFVKKHYLVKPGEEGKPAQPGNMAVLQKTYTAKGVIWLSICSSAPGKEGHKTIEGWKTAAQERLVAPTAILPDPDGTVGRLYDAKKTPTVFIVDPQGLIGYRGAVDDTPSPKADPATAKNYVAAFLDAVLAGKEPETRETSAYG